MASRANYSGLVIAGVGFFLTRFTVTLTIHETSLRFYLAGVVPLSLGLGLAAFGVALTVLDVEPSLVQTTARWCVIGVGATFVLVVLTLFGTTPAGVPEFSTIRSQTYLSNFLIGGSVGGTLIGLYAARNREQRSTLRHQTHRLEVLNRLLRHEVLNSVTVIRGYASVNGEETPDAERIIKDRADTIEKTIDEVRYLTRRVGTETESLPIELGACLADSRQQVLQEYPNTTIAVDAPEEVLTVRANERLDHVFRQLMENAIVHTPDDDPSVEVSVTPTATDVRVSVRDHGTGLPESQRKILEEGEIRRFDDPGAGFGLNIVRLLVESVGGGIETEIDEEGTTITVILPLAETRNIGFEASETRLSAVRPAAPQLVVTLGAALFAGVAYGVVGNQLGGSVAAIGVFYGIENAVVGWLTHQFHSVVFGFVFAGLASFTPEQYRDNIAAYVSIGIGWAVCLWIVAAGVIAPIWLRLIGIAAAIPNLSTTLFFSHLAWGIVLGVLTPLGYRHVVPWIERMSSPFE
ncbi:sensor histidine kinase [Halobellus ordinarius]|uniref:sensor histidine kinase n=1 Tax=Halobellus ordinarius TaxID=3075120 RepID=UPI00288031FA|nr:ATP-binding protein [Halobellus sp. ZY16]